LRPDRVNARDPEPNPASRTILLRTLGFLAVPGSILALSMVLHVRIPSPLLYALAGVVGLIIGVRSLTDPEWLMAGFLLYMPLSKEVIVPLAPGVNGVNIFTAMLILAAVVTSRRDGRPFMPRVPHTRLMTWWAILSCFSVVTLILRPGGLSYLVDDVALDFKGWLDQFFVFFLFVSLIRDGEMARRMVVYMMVGAVLAYVLGFQEMLDKQGLASLEKSRVLGPQLQPNSFGAFIVYSLPPFIGLFAVNLRRIRAWLSLPAFALVAKVLLATFSRGAYLAMGATALAAGYLRGKWLLAAGLGGVLIVVLYLPQLLPGSLVARMDDTMVQSAYSEHVDKSSETRLILWHAGVDMTLESPVFGKGFRVFPLLKSEYTERPVAESDNHNMYLYISSQMGIPAVVVFLLILYRLYRSGKTVYRNSRDRFNRAVGLGGAMMAVGVAVTNMFGSRMTNIEVCGYVWVYFAVLSHLLIELRDNEEAEGASAD